MSCPEEDQTGVGMYRKRQRQDDNGSVTSTWEEDDMGWNIERLRQLSGGNVMGGSTELQGK
jgi:hypothetical protein